MFAPARPVHRHEITRWTGIPCIQGRWTGIRGFFIHDSRPFSEIRGLGRGFRVYKTGGRESRLFALARPVHSVKFAALDGGFVYARPMDGRYPQTPAAQRKLVPCRHFVYKKTAELSMKILIPQSFQQNIKCFIFPAAVFQSSNRPDLQ